MITKLNNQWSAFELGMNKNTPWVLLLCTPVIMLGLFETLGFVAKGPLLLALFHKFVMPAGRPRDSEASPNTQRKREQARIRQARFQLERKKENKETKPLGRPRKPDGSPRTQDKREKARQRRAKRMENQVPPTPFEAVMESQKLIASKLGPGHEKILKAFEEHTAYELERQKTKDALELEREKNKAALELDREKSKAALELEREKTKAEQENKKHQLDLAKQDSFNRIQIFSTAKKAGMTREERLEFLKSQNNLGDRIVASPAMAYQTPSARPTHIRMGSISHDSSADVLARPTHTPMGSISHDRSADVSSRDLLEITSDFDAVGFDEDDDADDGRIPCGESPFACMMPGRQASALEASSSPENRVSSFAIATPARVAAATSPASATSGSPGVLETLIEKSPSVATRGTDSAESSPSDSSHVGPIPPDIQMYMQMRNKPDVSIEWFSTCYNFAELEEPNIAATLVLWSTSKGLDPKALPSLVFLPYDDPRDFAPFAEETGSDQARKLHMKNFLKAAQEFHMLDHMKHSILKWLHEQAWPDDKPDLPLALWGLWTNDKAIKEARLAWMHKKLGDPIMGFEPFEAESSEWSFKIRIKNILRCVEWWSFKIRIKNVLRRVVWWSFKQWDQVCVVPCWILK